MRGVGLALGAGLWLFFDPSGALADAAPPSAARAQAEDHALKAQAYFKLNRLSDAEAEFKQAQVIDPSWHDLTYNLGLIYEAEGKLAEAAAALREYQPFATPEELAPLRQKIAELEIKVADQQKAAAEARAKGEQEEQERKRKAQETLEADRQQKLAAEQRLAAQKLTITTADKTGMEGVAVVSEGGTQYTCLATIKPGAPCELQVPAGPAKVVWSTSSMNAEKGIERREDPFVVPVGTATLKLEPGNNLAMLLLAAPAGGSLLGAGLILTILPLLTSSSSSSSSSNSPDIGLVLVGVGLLGAGTACIIVGAILGSDNIAVEPSGGSASRGPFSTPRPLAFGVMPLPRGAVAGATFSF